MKGEPVIQRPLAFRLMAAAMMVPVPRAFVKMMACPACMPPLLINMSSLATPVTLKPAQTQVVPSAGVTQTKKACQNTQQCL